MKKSFLLIILFLSTIMIMSSCYYDNSEYPQGKDTKVYLGDGRYQILRGSMDTVDGKEVVVVTPEYYSDVVDNNQRVNDDSISFITTDDASQVITIRKYILFDGEEQETIEDDVYSYYVDDNKSKIYTIGNSGYTVLNFEQAFYENHDSVGDFETDDKDVFLNTSKFIELDYHRSLGNYYQ